jgi:hypothetical protein
MQAAGGRPARPTSTGHRVPWRRNWHWASWRWAGQECSAKAVDMTLCGPHSLANANALPICLRHLSGFCAPPDWRLAPMRVADRIPVRFIAPCRAGRHGGAVILLLRRRRPGDTRHFDGEGDRHLWMAARVLPAGHEIMRATQLIARGAIRYDFVPLQLSRIGVFSLALEQAPRHFPQGANQR